MNYDEWSSLRKGNRVKDLTLGKGIIISDVGVGYVVKFDNGKVMKITNGYLKRIKRN